MAMQLSARPFTACTGRVVRAVPGSGALRSVIARPQNGRRSVAAAAGTGLPIDLTGKKAFIAGVADDQGFGWAIAKALAEAGAEISLGVWVPALNIFETSFRRGKFDESRKLANGGMLDFAHIYAMDAVFDTPEDVPEEVRTNKRYAGAGQYTVSEVAERVKADVGNIDVLVGSAVIDTTTVLWHLTVS
eukprot:GHUV01023045.1.p1 GENE.GHUV01023045.1~~GHUV01023045.1.p1  ORF type:complete len:189 (+),score=49.49 GHUV01023045.1:388-954(+)